MPATRSFRVLLLGLALALVPAANGRAGEELDTRLKEIIHGPTYRHSRWGILVVDAKTGKPVFAHNADELFAAASVTKLFTGAAALAALGPDHRFRTPVHRRGELQDGHLHGDLILVAKGDPTLGGRTDRPDHLAFKNHDHTYASFLGDKAELTDTDPLAGLRALARQVRQRGIVSVRGEVLIDDRLFLPVLSSGSGARVVTPIMVNDNVIDVVVTPGAKVGEPASARIRPQSDFVHVDVQVETVAADEKPNIVTEFLGLHNYVVRGQVPLRSRPVVRICPVDDPEGFARALFIDALRREGVAVRASGLRRPTEPLPDRDAYAGLTQVARYESPPFSELLKVTLKVSHNLYASALPMLLAARADKRTLPAGMYLESKVLAELGVDVKGIALETGAGGGSCDRLTPRATVALLRSLAKRPDYPVFEAALPVLGVDGTLAGVVGKDSPACGKVRAKTGTHVDTDLLNDRLFLRCKSLAGVMTTKSGRSLVLALFVNDVPLPPGVQSDREGEVLGRLCEVLYEHTPEK